MSVWILVAAVFSYGLLPHQDCKGTLCVSYVTCHSHLAAAQVTRPVPELPEWTLLCVRSAMLQQQQPAEAAL